MYVFTESQSSFRQLHQHVTLTIQMHPYEKAISFTPLQDLYNYISVDMHPFSKTLQFGNVYEIYIPFLFSIKRELREQIIRKNILKGKYRSCFILPSHNNKKTFSSFARCVYTRLVHQFFYDKGKDIYIFNIYFQITTGVYIPVLKKRSE